MSGIINDLLICRLRIRGLQKDSLETDSIWIWMGVHGVYRLPAGLDV